MHSQYNKGKDDDDNIIFACTVYPCNHIILFSFLCLAFFLKEGTTSHIHINVRVKEEDCSHMFAEDNGGGDDDDTHRFLIHIS